MINHSLKAWAGYGVLVTWTSICLGQGERPIKIEPVDRIPREGNIFAHPIAFSHDGKLIAASSYNEAAIRIVDIKSKKTIAKVKASRSAPHVCFSLDGKLLATSGPRSEPPRIWNTTDWTLYHEFDDVKAPTGRVFFSADSAIFCASSHSEGVFLWDVKTKKRIKKKIESDLVDSGPGVLAPNGKTVAFGNGKGEIQLVDAETGRKIVRWKAHDERTVVVFSPDSKTLASSGTSARIARLWKTADGSLIETVLTPERFQTLKRIDFSPDGRWLGIAAYWPAVAIFDAKTGGQVFELVGSEHQFEWIAFSPDGVTVAAPSRDGAIFLWTLPKQK